VSRLTQLALRPSTYDIWKCEAESKWDTTEDIISHLCQWHSCGNVGHSVWESGSINVPRNACLAKVVGRRTTSIANANLPKASYVKATAATHAECPHIRACLSVPSTNPVMGAMTMRWTTAKWSG
jgi:hypothetical protein